METIVDLWRVVELLIGALVGVLVMLYKRLETRVTKLEERSATKKEVDKVLETVENNRRENREDFKNVNASLGAILLKLSRHD